MHVIENFHVIERRIGLIYSSKFYEFLEEFINLVNSDKFKYLFGKFHFCTGEDIQRAIEEGVSEEFSPFFIEEHSEFKDYYCFERENLNNKCRVIIFSQNSIVFEWESPSDFIFWVRGKLSA
jgi:hypothetical protein